jgi:hypothetical protein
VWVCIECGSRLIPNQVAFPNPSKLRCILFLHHSHASIQRHGERGNSHLYTLKTRTCIKPCASSVKMQPLPPGTPKYTDPIGFQPELEVGVNPYASAHTGWPDATKPVWGLNSEQLLRPNQKRKILGLSVGVF